MSDYLLNCKAVKPCKIKGFQERITGIEPASPAWEAGILPMNYIRMNIV